MLPCETEDSLLMKALILTVSCYLLVGRVVQCVACAASELNPGLYRGLVRMRRRLYSVFSLAFTFSEALTAAQIIPSFHCAASC